MSLTVEINGKYFRQVEYNQEDGCNECALNEKCNYLAKEAEIKPTEEIIRKVLQLSDEADKAFKEGCRFISGATIDERLDNIKRQQAGLSSEERIKYIKDHWGNTYYLHLIRNGKELITVKI